MYGITVMEFLELFIDPDRQQFQIWSNKMEKVLFKGYISHIPDEFIYANVTYVDNIKYMGDCITINID